MEKDSLNKIIKLIQKTGDRVIVLNEGEPSLVMMGFAEYEKLIFGKNSFKDLTKEELVDRINKEIAFCKEEQGEKGMENIKTEPEFKEEIRVEEIKNSEQKIEEAAEENYEVEPLIK